MGTLRRVTVGELSCLITGTGPPVVLLHGLAGSAREVAAPLSGHQVIMAEPLHRPERFLRGDLSGDRTATGDVVGAHSLSSVVDDSC